MCYEKGKGQNKQFKQEPYGKSKALLEVFFFFLNDIQVWKTAINTEIIKVQQVNSMKLQKQKQTWKEQSDIWDND